MKVTCRRVIFFWLVSLMGLLCFQCSRQEAKDKIKLDSAQIRQTNENAGLTTTLKVQPEKLRSIVIFNFENVTGDEELQWMRRGLTQMLITDLSQSRYVDIVTESDLASVMQKMGVSEDQTIDASTAVAVAREAQLETALVGSFIRIGETIRIDCHLYDAQSGKLLKADRVEDQGLEKVFTMVDQLTRQVKDGLKLTLKGVVEFDKGLADVTTNSVDAYRYFSEGLELQEKLFYLEAVDRFKRAVSVDTTFATAYFHLALAYLNLARPDDSRRVVAKAMVFTDHVTEMERLNIMALDARLKGDYIEQIEIYEQMVQRFPNNKETHYQLANMLDDLARFDEAIAHYEAALEIDKTYKLVYNQLGYLYSELGWHEEAVENLKRYVELAPDEPNPHDSMGEIYQRAGLFEEAIDEFKEAIRLGPDLHFPWLHLGLSYQDKGNFNDAIECFERHLEMAPSEAIKAGAYRLIAESYWAKGEVDKALDAYHESEKVYPQDFDSVDDISELYMEHRDSLTMRAYQNEWFHSTGEKVIQKNTFSDIVTFIGTSLYSDINISELQPYLKRAWKLVENDRNTAACNGLQALIDFKQGHVDSAMARWETILSLPWIQTSLGMDFYNVRIISQALVQSMDKPEAVQQLYDQIIDIARQMENVSLEASTEFFLFEYSMKIDDDTNLERGLKATGAPRESDWWIIGPFESKGGFQRRFPPERETKLSKTYNGKDGKIQWKQAHDSLFDGYVDLKALLDPDIWTVAYGLLSFDCPIARQAQFRIGTDDAVRIWLNGVEVWTKNTRRPARIDNDIIPVDLKTGTNTVLIKVCQTISEWGFFFRITDPEGHAFGDIIYLPQVIS